MQHKTRAALAVATVAILVIAFVALRPGDDTATTSAAVRTAAPTPATPDATTSATTTAKPTAAPKPPLLTAARVTKLTATKGDTVRFRARSAAADEIHVHGYDLSKEVPAGETVSVSFKATIEGVFEIEFENAGTQIASLRVNP